MMDVSKKEGVLRVLPLTPTTFHFLQRVFAYMSSPAGPSNNQTGSQDPPPPTQDADDIDELDSQPRKKIRRVSDEGDDAADATQVKDEHRTNGKGKKRMEVDEGDDGDEELVGREDGRGEAAEDEVGDGNGLNLELSVEQQRKLASRHEDGSVQHLDALKVDGIDASADHRRALPSVSCPEGSFV